MLLPSLAWAQAVRYNDAPPPPPRGRRWWRASTSWSRAWRQRSGAPSRGPMRGSTPLRPRSRGLAPSSGPPANELVQGALWVHGIVEPSPHLILATMGPGGDEELLRELGGDLPAVLAQGRYSRVGVGLVPAGGGETRRAGGAAGVVRRPRSDRARAAARRQRAAARPSARRIPAARGVRHHARRHGAEPPVHRRRSGALRRHLSLRAAIRGAIRSR